MQTHDYWLIAAFSPSYWFLPHGWALSVPSHGRRAYLADSTARAAGTMCYRAAGVDPEGEQTWEGYSLALLSLTAISLAALFAILVLQGQLP